MSEFLLAEDSAQVLSEAESQAITEIAASVRQIQFRSVRRSGFPRARRDAHPKAHGLVQAIFQVHDAAHFAAVQSAQGVDLRAGVFAEPGRKYRAWLRFSSSSQRIQSDEVPDGRGLAIKLLLGPGEHLRLTPQRLEPEGPGDAEGSSAQTQDFVLVNGPAFFAKDAAEMVRVAALEAADRFPSNYLLVRPRALLATLAMVRAQADSPTQNTYFSQTPYRLGNLVVKWRVRPKLGSTPGAGSGGGRAPARRGDDYLRHALAGELALDAWAEGEPESLQPAVVLEFSAQLARRGDALDDATEVWPESTHPFIPLAEVALFPQRTDHESRLGLAENLAFSPWNGVAAHEPLGSINRARGVVYEQSRRFRQKLNQVDRDRDEAEVWQQEFRRGRRQEPAAAGSWPTAPRRDGLARRLVTLAHVVPGLGERLVKFLSSRWAYGALAAGAIGWLAWVYQHPEQEVLTVDLTGLLPSEAAIPPAVWAAGRAEASVPTLLAQDPVFAFRYGATGTEYDAGIPYWIFRALPRLAPHYFGGYPDYRAVGLDIPDDQSYYQDYHGLPRGVVVTDTRLATFGIDIEARLSRVAFNCATCHRGEYTDAEGTRHFVDGMPNNVADTVAFKLAVHRTVRDPRVFSAERVIEEVDRLLAEEHARRPRTPDGRPTPQALTEVERGVYALLTAEMKKRAEEKPIEWILERPKNGPGRVDAFGALRFEFLGYDFREDHHVAVVGLPAIWNQRAAIRPVHHWDGNTSDSRARNYGAIIGVGGTPLSVRREEVDRVGAWIDQLPSPPFPYAPAAPEVLSRGRDTYLEHCAHCHGTYDSGRLPTLTTCMREPLVDVGTDRARLEAVDLEFVSRLNAFGARVGLWGPTAFSASRAYLCPPLDGIWARAPYLHNDSIPSLADLLAPPAERPKTFYRGNTRYDSTRGGFSTEAPAEGPRAFEFVTQEQDAALVGNSALGHDFPIVDPEQRRELIAYLLTL